MCCLKQAGNTKIGKPPPFRTFVPYAFIRNADVNSESCLPNIKLLLNLNQKYDFFFSETKN